MKNRPFVRIVLVIAVFLSLTMSATVSHAGGASLHACVAGSLFPNHWLLRYYAASGGPSNDFAWFSGDLNLINDPVALHEQFDEIAFGQANWWNFGRWAFALGTETHLCVDREVDQFIPGWIAAFVKLADENGITEEEISEIAPLLPAVFDFVVDVLFLGENDPQLQHLIFHYKDAIWVEDIVEEFSGSDPGFNVRLVYKEFFFILRVLERLAICYGPLLRGEDEISNGFFDNGDLADLIGMSSNLSNESFERYLAMFNILVNFPDILYAVVTEPVSDGNGLPAWKVAVNNAKACVD